MLRRLRRAIKTTANFALRPFDLTLMRRGRPTPGPEFLEAIYCELGIDLVLDVGANAGQSGEALRLAGYRGRIVSFEPQAAAFERLMGVAAGDRLWECHRLALGEAHGTLTMNISGLSWSSSFLHMARKHMDLLPASAPVGVEDVPIARLGGLAEALRVRHHKTLLKIDVQGYELQVLRGAVEVLPQLTAAFVELSFAPLYHGQSNYYEVMGALEVAGLHFVGMFNSNWDPTNGHLLWADGLFVRTSDAR